MRKIFKILIYLAFLTVIFLPVFAFAQTPPTVSGIIDNLPPSRFGDAGALIRGVIDLLLLLTGIIAVVAVVYSGVMYLTAGGDVAKAESARKNLIWAITGIILIVLSFTIVNWVMRVAS